MSAAAAGWHDAYEWVERLAGLDDAARDDALGGLARDQPDLYPRVATLLRARDALDHADGFLGGHALDAVEITKAGGPQPASTLEAGQMLGPWRLERTLGAGGMGEVWLARRADGLVEAPVALKFLHPHLAGSSLSRRFVREGRILGQLSHPHVARLLDAGALPDGRLYLALEYVEGERLDRWCDTQCMPLRERLRLFRDVCDAVAHAHARLVVHRDLKPSNILVTQAGDIKLLDFGIAKLIEREEGASDATELTRLGGRALTPEYAAPEQLLGAPVTVATDVYALGVILYGLLTGRRPYGPAGASLVALEHAAIHDVPALPSQARALTSDEPPAEALARMRGETPETLRQALRGDLDTLVMKALKKAPAERYASVAALGEDVRRWLDDEPLLARPDSTAYRVAKFWARHRVGVAAAGVVLATLIAGVAAVAYEWRQARAAQRAQAERAAELAKVVDFQGALLARVDVQAFGRDWLDRTRTQLEARLAQEAGRSPADVAAAVASFDQLRPWTAPSEVARQALGADVLGPAEREIGQRFADQPRTQAALRASLARAYADLGLFEPAAEQAARAAELYVAQSGAHDPATLSTRLLQARIQAGQGDAKAAVVTATDVATEQARRLGAEHPDTLAARALLARLQLEANDYDAALAIARPLVDTEQRVAGSAHPDTLAAQRVLAEALLAKGDFKGARALASSNLAASRRVLGEDDPGTMATMKVLATAAFQLSDFPTARAIEEQLLAARRRVLGESHPDTIAALSDLAQTVLEMGDTEGGGRMLRQAFEESQAALGPAHPFSTRIATNYALQLYDQGRFPEARAIQQQIVDVRSRTLGPEKPQTLLARNNLAITMAASGHVEEARALQASTLDAQRRVIGPEHPQTLYTWRQLAVTLMKADRPDEARREFEAMRDVHVRVLGAESEPTLNLLTYLGGCDVRLGRYEEAQRLLNETLATSQRLFGAEAPQSLQVQSDLARALHGLHRDAEAQALALRTLAGWQTQQGANSPDARQEMQTLLEIARSRGDAAGAREWSAKLQPVSLPKP